MIQWQRRENYPETSHGMFAHTGLSLHAVEWTFPLGLVIYEGYN